MSRRKREIGLQLASQNINNRTFLDIYTRLKNLAVTRFQWKNLPLICDAITIEMSLFVRGNCLYFDEEFKSKEFIEYHSGKSFSKSTAI